LHFEFGNTCKHTHKLPRPKSFSEWNLDASISNAVIKFSNNIKLVYYNIYHKDTQGDIREVKYLPWIGAFYLKSRKVKNKGKKSHSSIKTFLGY